MKVLVVIDMQNDMVTGPLGNADTRRIVPNVLERVKKFDGMVLATMDTHSENYYETEEGRFLPVVHCVKGTNGWNLLHEFKRLLVTPPIEKSAFGSVDLGRMLESYNKIMPITEITLIGFCIDASVCANAILLKSFLPDAKVIVDVSCCAPSTPDKLHPAILAMQSCQITVLQ